MRRCLLKFTKLYYHGCSFKASESDLLSYQSKELETLSRTLAEAAADVARSAAARREANASAAAMEQRLRADLDRETAAERRLAADIHELEQRLEAIRGEQVKEAAEAAAKAAELEASVHEREAQALQSEARIADLKERLQKAESLWDGLQKPEVCLVLYYGESVTI